MARIRTIKPEFWSSPDIGDVTRDARLTFIGLWTNADDHGRLEVIPATLARTLFPYDVDVDADQLCAWLNELNRQGLVRLYAQGRRAYLHITGWDDHQKIDKPSKPRCPDPDDCRQLDSISSTVHLDLAPGRDPSPTLFASPSRDPRDTFEGPSRTDRRTVGPSERGTVGPTPTVAASGDDAPVDDFDEFWDAYPRGPAGKPGGDGPKKPAARSWQRLTAEQRTAALEAVGHYAAHVNSPDGPRAAHATTWLNQERWEQWATPARASPDGPAPPNPVDAAVRLARNFAGLPWDDVAGKLAAEGLDHDDVVVVARQAWDATQEHAA